MNTRRGVAVVTYNRGPNLEMILDAVESTVSKDVKLVVADDGSTDDTEKIVLSRKDRWVLIKGPNLGVAANKNRALWGLQDCHFMAIIEDDLHPIKSGWFSLYEQVAIYSEIHHFCRVQNKQVNEIIPEFSKDLSDHGVKPIYGPSPRGDFTFITRVALDKVGGLNPRFRGAGYAHGEWSARIDKAGLIPHPLKWIDLRPNSEEDIFKQLGDTEGGRWDVPKETIKEQLIVNKKIRNELNLKGEIYCPLILE